MSRQRQLEIMRMSFEAREYLAGYLEGMLGIGDGEIAALPLDLSSAAQELTFINQLNAQKEAN